MIVRDGEDHGPRILVVFERGHARKLKVETRWGDGWGREWMLPALSHFLAQPVARLITEVELRVSPRSQTYEGLVEAITSHGLPAVRTFYAGDDDQVSWTYVPDVTTLWAAAPQLEEVTLEGSRIGIGNPSHPRLKRLELESGGLPRQPVHALASADLPALESLEIWFGDSEYGAQCDIGDVRPLLQRAFPALKRVGLVNCAFGDEVARAVLEATWLPQIEELALFGSILTDEGARALRDAADGLAHLKQLDVSEGFLTDSGVAALQATFGDRVKADFQNDAFEDGDDEGFYYVALGE